MTTRQALEFTKAILDMTDPGRREIEHPWFGAEVSIRGCSRELFDRVAQLGKVTRRSDGDEPGGQVAMCVTHGVLLKVQYFGPADEGAKAA